MTENRKILSALTGLKKASPSGFALAMHVRFTTPALLFQTYPKAWTDYYSQHGLVMSDPTVAWAFENLGTCRWSELAAQDSQGVLTRAGEHGLRYGVTCAVSDDNISRSMGSLARADREWTDAEVDDFAESMKTLHNLTAKLETLAPETVTALKNLSVRLTQTA